MVYELGTCPSCDQEIEYVRFCDDFKCPKCNARISHRHECEGDDEGNCYDYLEPYETY
jgi:predicted RNA-binding Zn-ribbon protein involved in translation (DUF1610 family)